MESESGTYSCTAAGSYGQGRRWQDVQADGGDNASDHERTILVKVGWRRDGCESSLNGEDRGD
jgi:hypothetical protein